MIRIDERSVVVTVDVKRDKKIIQTKSVNLSIKTRITAKMIRNQMTRFYPKMNVLDGNTFLMLACALSIVVVVENNTLLMAAVFFWQNSIFFFEMNGF